MHKHDPDYLLMSIIACLVAAGLVLLYSASSFRGAFYFGDSAYYIKHQVLYGILPGIAVFLVGYTINPRWIRRFSFIFLFVMLVLLALVVSSKFGVEFRGAARWLRLGPAIFQPSEFLKLAFIIYLADFFARRTGKLDNFWRTTLPFLIVLGVTGAMLLAQPATSTLGIIAATALVIYFFSGGRLKDIVIMMLLGSVVFFVLLFSAPYRLERVMTYLNPERDPKGAGYQINQAIIAIGSGGMWGVGLGHSKQKYNFLPETIGDSIFAIYAEETGFFGSLVLIAFFFGLAHRGFRAALRSRDAFMRLVAGGIAFWLVGQAFLNMAAISGLLPLTGVPLPFISYGGSALVAALAGAGILLNISRYTIK